MATKKQRKRQQERRIAHARRTKGPKAKVTGYDLYGYGSDTPYSTVRIGADIASNPDETVLVLAPLTDSLSDFTPLGDSVNGMYPVDPEQIPSRAQCPECGKREKVRKDGTMTKHTYGPEGRACAGTGLPYVPEK